MAQETWVQSQVESYQKLKKWYLMPLCLTFSIIRYVSRVKWSNPGKRVTPSPIFLWSSYWKGAFESPSTTLPDIDLGVRVFANGPGDLGSIPGRVIPKTQKMVLDASLLNTQHYKVRIKGKVEQSREGVAPSPAHWCSSYRKGSLRVTRDNGR